MCRVYPCLTQVRNVSSRLGVRRRPRAFVRFSGFLGWAMASFGHACNMQHDCIVGASLFLGGAMIALGHACNMTALLGHCKYVSSIITL